MRNEKKIFFFTDDRKNNTNIFLYFSRYFSYLIIRADLFINKNKFYNFFVITYLYWDYNRICVLYNRKKFKKLKRKYFFVLKQNKIAV